MRWTYLKTPNDPSRVILCSETNIFPQKRWNLLLERSTNKINCQRKTPLDPKNQRVSKICQSFHLHNINLDKKADINLVKTLFLYSVWKRCSKMTYSWITILLKVLLGKLMWSLETFLSLLWKLEKEVGKKNPTLTTSNTSCLPLLHKQFQQL